MNKICTSIEQSKKLIELGIDVNTADMLWKYDSFQKFHRLELFEEGFPKTISKEDIPAWSLSALLYLLDNPQLFNHDDVWDCDGYTCIGHYHDNAIDAVFEVVEAEAKRLQKGAKKTWNKTKHN